MENCQNQLEQSAHKSSLRQLEKKNQKEHFSATFDNNDKCNSCNDILLQCGMVSFI